MVKLRSSQTRNYEFLINTKRAREMIDKYLIIIRDNFLFEVMV